MDLLDLSPHPLFMILFIIQGLYNQFRGAGAFTSLFGAGLAFVAPLMAFVVYACPRFLLCSIRLSQESSWRKSSCRFRVINKV